MRRPIETSRSCIACKSAAWVLGGVRLISSASRKLVKIGPGRNSSLRRPVAGVLLDDVHAGDVRGHQVGRELDAAKLEVERPRQGAGHQGLAQPGHTQQEDVAAAEQADQHVIDDRLLADDHLGDLFADAEPRIAQASHDGGVFARERGGIFGLASRVPGFPSVAGLTR